MALRIFRGPSPKMLTEGDQIRARSDSKRYCHIEWHDLYPYMEAADLMRDTHRRSRRLSAERYPHTIRAGRLNACPPFLHLLLPTACKGGRTVRCADRILCLSSPPEPGLDRGVAEGSFSVLFVRGITVLGQRTLSAEFPLSYRDGGSYKSRR